MVHRAAEVRSIDGECLNAIAIVLQPPCGGTRLVTLLWKHASFGRAFHTPHASIETRCVAFLYSLCVL